MLLNNSMIMYESDAVGMSGIIERFEGTLAIVLLNDGQTIRWPIKDLPEDCAQGTSVRLVLRTSASDQTEREQLAKSILNEILRGDERKKS